LWENSAVTFGANEFTPVIDVAKSSENKDVLIEKLNDLSERFENTIRNGKGSDARHENLELMFKQIRHLQNSLSNLKPSTKDTLKEEAEKQKEKEQEQKIFWLKQIGNS
jgi:hypothetical protein